MNTRDTLHTNLKHYRMQKGLSQTEVADILGVSRQTISNWESQRSYPDLDNIVRLSDLYGITIDQLFGKEKSHDCISASEQPKENLILGIPSHTMLEMLCLAVILVLACINVVCKNSSYWRVFYFCILSHKSANNIY